MATDNAESIVRHALAETQVIEAFETIFAAMIAAELQPVSASDFFTEASALMKREARAERLRQIMAVFRAMHEDAKSDNPYNLNQT